jgi:hypothetical protein
MSFQQAPGVPPQEQSTSDNQHNQLAIDPTLASPALPSPWSSYYPYQQQQQHQQHVPTEHLRPPSEASSQAADSPRSQFDHPTHSAFAMPSSNGKRAAPAASTSSQISRKKPRNNEQDEEIAEEQSPEPQEKAKPTRGSR